MASRRARSQQSLFGAGADAAGAEPQMGLFGARKPGALASSRSPCRPGELRVQLGQESPVLACARDFAQASALFVAARDASGEGASGFGGGVVLDGSGRAVARISYNGKVWPVAEWFSGQRPLYSPYDSDEGT